MARRSSLLLVPPSRTSYSSSWRPRRRSSRRKEYETEYEKTTSGFPEIPDDDGFDGDDIEHYQLAYAKGAIK